LLLDPGGRLDSAVDRRRSVIAAQGVP
jgi:hypothetical protein